MQGVPRKASLTCLHRPHDRNRERLVNSGWQVEQPHVTEVDPLEMRDMIDQQNWLRVVPSLQPVNTLVFHSFLLENQLLGKRRERTEEEERRVLLLGVIIGG